MTTTPFEMPKEMREFAERSVEQARKAFEGFLGVAEKTVGAFDQAAASTEGNAKSIGAHVIGFAEQNVNAAFDLAQKLVKANSPQEAIAMQTEYLKAQLVVMQEQAKQVGALMHKTALPGSK
ncbi:MAG: phasin [Roseiarcus sp.]